MPAVLPVAGIPLRRAASRRRGWLAAAVAIVFNLGVVAVLGRLAGPARVEAAPPLAAITLHRIPPPTPAPPTMTSPADASVRAAPAAPAACAAPPMPDLEPAIMPAADAPLPSDAAVDALPDLDLAMPVLAPDAGGGSGTGPAPGPPDQPAVRDGAFDLDRHYPRAARLRGLTGTTRIRLAISADGRVASVAILASSPPGVFEQAAERLARDLRFTPATSAGQPVPSTQDTTITWTLR